MFAEQPIQSISDTARWAAGFRALETARSDALFRDPLAEQLAGQRGEDAVRTMPSGTRHAWAWTTRTYLFDQFITAKLAEGVDAVVNLAAGLDARPYRMELRRSLRWYEVDLPALLDYKTSVLRKEKPRCTLERVPLDLSDIDARRDLFERIQDTARNVLVLTEGLLIYWAPEAVATLARDLASLSRFQSWITDLASPGVLRMLQRNIGKPLNEAGAALKFGPAEGTAFFEPFGWRAAEVQSSLKTAAKLKRLPFLLRLLALLPDTKGPPGNRPWSGVCLLERETGANVHRG